MAKQTIKDLAVDAAALVKTTAEATATSLNIQYIQRDILEIKTTLKEMSTIYVKRDEHDEVLKIQGDHETRTRSLEKGQTQIMTYGSVLVIALGIAEFLILRFYK